MRNTYGLRLGAGVIGALSAIAILPGAAGAAFDAGHAAQCQGATTIAGAGASFQNSAHLAWGAAVQTTPASALGFGYASTAAGGCSSFRLSADGGSNAVTYGAGGSGAGRAAVGASTTAGQEGVRNTAVHFGAADEPPTTAQLKAANDGPDKVAGTADDAILHTIPVAQSSVAIAVRLPDGCTVPAGDRVITKTRLEGAFAASANADTWGEILPTISGTGCAAKSFKRIVRSSDSGTTFALKSFLQTVVAANWPASQANTAWPNSTTANLDNTGGTNAGGLMDRLTAQSENGGIGYADLATARSKGYDPAANDPQRFWLAVERSAGQYLSPALQGSSATGANCRNVTYNDAVTGELPSTTESWFTVSGAGTAIDYPLCSLTYALVWEDMAKAQVGRAAGAPAYTQGQARAVKDYLGYVVNPAGGQARLEPAGFQALPVDPATGEATEGTILRIAQEGVKQLTWNGQPVVDPGEEEPPGEEPPGEEPPVVDPPVVGPPPVVPVIPVVPVVPVVPNTPVAPAPTVEKARVSVSTAAALKGRSIRLTVRPSAAGKVSVRATVKSGKRNVTVARASGSAKKAGALRLTVKPTSAGKRQLKAGRTVRVTFRVTFTAADGSKVTSSKTLRVKIKR